MKKIALLAALVLAMGIGVPASAQDKPTVAIIGTGNLARILGPALGRQGYGVVYGSRDPERDSVRALVAQSGARAAATRQPEAAARAGIIVLAVPGDLVAEVASTLGPLAGKVVVDVSAARKRVAADGYLELATDSANAERLQVRFPAARVVRVNLPFNALAVFSKPGMLGAPPTVLIASNHTRAREVAAGMVFDLGLEPWDAGPLRFARVFDAINMMGLVPAQQGRTQSYELKLLPSMPLSCFLNMSDLFGFGRPYDLDSLPTIPQRTPPVTCDEWWRRAGIGEPQL